MSEFYKCKYADDRVKFKENGKGYCNLKGGYCNGDGGCFDEFESYFTELQKNDICCNASLFGNELINISNKDIEALKQGKVLAGLNSEYCVFIKLDDEVKDE